MFSFHQQFDVDPVLSGRQDFVPLPTLDVKLSPKSFLGAGKVLLALSLVTAAACSDSKPTRTEVKCQGPGTQIPYKRGDTFYAFAEEGKFDRGEGVSLYEGAMAAQDWSEDQLPNRYLAGAVGSTILLPTICDRVDMVIGTTLSPFDDD